MRIRPGKLLLFVVLAGGAAVVLKQRQEGAAELAPSSPSEPFMAPSPARESASVRPPDTAMPAPEAEDAADLSEADTAEIVLPTSSAADATEPGPLPVPPHGPFTTAPDGPADDLKRISGVGPKLEALLNEQGITTFAQLAALSDEDVDALQERLSQFPGRIRRDDWVAQATRFVEEG